MDNFPLFYRAFSEVISTNPKKENNLWRLKNSPKRFLGYQFLLTRATRSARMCCPASSHLTHIKERQARVSGQLGQFVLPYEFILGFCILGLGEGMRWAQEQIETLLPWTANTCV